MPEGSVQYKVRAPDGRSIIITGFKPPTKEQLDRIFASLPQRTETEIGPPESLAMRRIPETVPGKRGTLIRGTPGDIELESPEFERTLQEMLSRGAPRPSGPLQGQAFETATRGGSSVGPLTRNWEPGMTLAVANQARFDENMEILGIPARMATALARGERIAETWNSLNVREKEEMGINLISWMPQRELVKWMALGATVVAKDAPTVLKVIGGMEAERRAAGVAGGTRRGTRGTAQAEEALGLDEATKNIQAFVKETGQTIKQKAQSAGQDVATWVQNQRARVVANRAAAAARAAEVPVPPKAPPLEVPEPLPTTPVEAPQTPQEATRASLWQRMTGRGGTPPVEAPAAPGGQIELTPALERAVQTRMMDRAGAEAMMRKQFPERFPKEAAPGKAKAPQTKADQLIARSRMIETLEKQVREGRISREEFMEAVAEQWPEEAARIAAQPAGRRPAPARQAAAPVTPGEAPAGATPAPAVPEAPPVTEADLTSDQIMEMEKWVQKELAPLVNKGGMSAERARQVFKLKAQEMGWPLPPEPTGPPPVREAPLPGTGNETTLARSPSDYAPGGRLGPPLQPAPAAPVAPAPAAPIQAAPAPTVAAPTPAPGGPQLVRGIRAETPAPAATSDLSEVIRAENDKHRSIMIAMKETGASNRELREFDEAHLAKMRELWQQGGVPIPSAGGAEPTTVRGITAAPTGAAPTQPRLPIQVPPEPVTPGAGGVAVAEPGPVTSLKVGGRQVEADPAAMKEIQEAFRAGKITREEVQAHIARLRSGVDPEEVLRSVRGAEEGGAAASRTASTATGTQNIGAVSEVPEVATEQTLEQMVWGDRAEEIQAAIREEHTRHAQRIGELRSQGGSDPVLGNPATARDLRLENEQHAARLHELTSYRQPGFAPEALQGAPEATGGVPGGEPAPTLPSPLPEAPTPAGGPPVPSPGGGMGILDEPESVGVTADPLAEANRAFSFGRAEASREFQSGKITREQFEKRVEELTAAREAAGPLNPENPPPTPELYTRKESGAYSRLSQEEREAVEAEWQDLSERVLNGELTPEQALAEMGNHPALADVVPQRQQVLGGGLGAEPVSPLQNLERPISGRGRPGADDEAGFMQIQNAMGLFGGATGAAGGAATGYGIGDTEEEKIRNAIILGLGGGVAGAGLGYVGGNEARIWGEGGKSFLGRTGHMFDQYQQAAMMMGPAQWKSLFGGASAAPIRVIENWPLHPIQATKQAGQGFAAIPRGLKAAFNTAWTGQNPMFSATLNRKPAEGIASVPFRAVATPDAFFREILRSMTPTSDEAAKLASQGILDPNEQKNTLAARWMMAGEPQTKTGRLGGNFLRGSIPDAPPNASDELKELIETANKVGPVVRAGGIPIGYTAGTNLLEQGLQRTPGINFLLQGKNNPLRVRPAQSLVNFGLGTGAVGAGALADMFLPEGRQYRAAAAAGTGPYAVPFMAGAELNQYLNSRNYDPWGLPKNILTSLARGTPLSGLETDPVKWLTDVPGRLKAPMWDLLFAPKK